MTGFIDASLSRSRLVVAALIFILLAGWIAWRDIPKESEPDVRIPIIFVRMTHEGISPEDAERLLVRPMEQELRSILAEAAYKPNRVLTELAQLRSLTPPGTRPLAEDLVREGRDER